MVSTSEASRRAGSLFIRDPRYAAARTATRDIDKRLADIDEHGAETGEATWLIRPRSFLIIGDLEELRGPGGVHPDKHQSFELYRRNLYEPEIITFDELLARAEWHVEVAEQDDLSHEPW